MGTPSKKEKVGEVVLHTIEELQKIALSFIPAGPLFDGILGYYARLKQRRIIDFSGKLKEVFEENLDRKLAASDFENEDFIDVMEAVYSKVQTTQSIYKLERFRNILVKQIIEPQPEASLVFKYIKLLDNLNDVQIHILDDFRYWQGQRIINIIIAYEGDIGVNYADDYVIKRVSDKVGFDVSIAEVEYFTNELVSLGLIRNDSKVITAMGASSPQNNFQITSIGKAFLDFIENPTTSK